ncbi:MAG TPA: MFS transporter [Acidimicrobiales bacterium]|nr:MFS transporter [Acidimicrobiales bacterium]
MTTVAAPAGRRAVVLTLAVLCVAQFMLIVDVVVVNVALPSIREALEVSEARLHLVAYPLTFGSLLIVFGRAGDLFGPRHLFLTGVAVFTVASLASGLAGSEWQLVAARAAQGVGAAMVSPTARPPRHRRVGKCEWTRH